MGSVASSASMRSRRPCIQVRSLCHWVWAARRSSALATSAKGSASCSPSFFSMTAFWFFRMRISCVDSVMPRAASLRSASWAWASASASIWGHKAAKSADADWTYLCYQDIFSPLD